MRSNYWSNSKIADFIRGTSKPYAATSNEWTTWKKASKKLYPLRHWIVEEGFDKVQNFCHWPADKLDAVKYNFINRFITKTHALTSSTLKRGAWTEFGTRVLHCNFDELVNFVEIESAWGHITWGDKEERDKYNVPWHSYGWWRMRVWRCPAAGLDHLYWAAALTYDTGSGVSSGNALFGTPTTQAETAKEILALYHWWKNVRPVRPDVHDESGWHAVCESRREKENNEDLPGDYYWFGETPEEVVASKAALNKSVEIEEAYNKEDEEMLIRFVKLSPKLWT